MKAFVLSLTVLLLTCLLSIASATVTNYTCAPDQRVGDVNGDGEIDFQDAGIINLIAQGSAFIDGDDCCADVDSDGDVDTYDANMVWENRDSTGVPPCFPAGYSCSISENCTDGGDNDCDGFVDLNDTDCCSDECSSNETRCVGNTMETCANCDEDICFEWCNPYDCFDCSCSCGVYTTGSEDEVSCSDGIDNDCDGFVDCVSGNEDSDCDCGGSVVHYNCSSDRLVGDLSGNGVINFQDVGMINLVAQGDAVIDGDDCCADVDGDGDVDEADRDLVWAFTSGNVSCFPAGYSCSAMESCEDGIDNDCDGFVDCVSGNEDPDCDCSECQQDSDCDDSDACTIDTCSGVPKSCSNAPITTCVDGDGCCPSSCTPTNDNDCGDVAHYSCSPDRLMGDLNGNGVRNFQDVGMINLVAQGSAVIDGDDCCADVDGDGDVDAYDANMVWENRDGQENICFPAGYSCSMMENCVNGVDDDCDNSTDCYDDDCTGNPACIEICDNGIDDDGDGFVDCNDLYCIGHPACLPETEKDMSKYTGKLAFLISDADWRDVLGLVPVAVWTDESGINKYPLLVYHEEEITVATAPLSFSIGDLRGDTLEVPDGAWQSFVAEDDFVSRISVKDGMSLEDILAQDFSTYYLQLQDSNGNVISTSEEFTPEYIYEEHGFVFNVSVTKGAEYRVVWKAVNGSIFTFYSSGNIYSSGAYSENPDYDLEMSVYKGYGLKSFDADSIIYFLQQYGPNSLRIVGDTPPELDNLLIADPEVGAGLESGQVQRIQTTDYLGYWSSFAEFVYVEDDYEKALVASAYASLINVPLVVRGSSLDSDNLFQNRKVVCIGNVPVNCTESYTLEQLQAKYIAKTETNKIIMVNPDDLNIKKTETLQPTKSPTPIYKLFTKTSLMAPILAGAKHQVIFPIRGSTYPEFDTELEDKISTLMPYLTTDGFLTILAAPNAIPIKEDMHATGSHSNYRSLDHSEYADMPPHDNLPDLSAGRIRGMTTSDVSAYVARSVFYGSIFTPNKMEFMASSFNYMISNSESWKNKFENAGYDSHCSIKPTSSGTDSDCEIVSNSNGWPELWESKELISYMDHGGSTWAGISYSQIPLLKNSIVTNDACSTCSAYKKKSFCDNVIRKGGLVHMGALSVAWTGNHIYRKTLNGIYYYDQPVGVAFRDSYKYSRYRYMTTLLGDPTLDINPEYLLEETL